MSEIVHIILKVFALVKTIQDFSKVDSYEQSTYIFVFMNRHFMANSGWAN